MGTKVANACPEFGDEGNREISDQEREDFLYEIDRKHRKRLLGYANRYIRDEHGCEDMVQLCLIAANEHINTIYYLEEKAIVSYLYTTVRNISISYIRGDHFQYTEEIDSMESYLCDHRVMSMEKRMILQEETNRVHKAILSLSRIYREVILLYFVEELSIEEIAEKLGKSKAAVKQRLARGKQQLLEILSEEEQKKKNSENKNTRKKTT